GFPIGLVRLAQAPSQRPYAHFPARHHSAAASTNPRRPSTCQVFKTWQVFSFHTHRPTSPRPCGVTARASPPAPAHRGSPDPRPPPPHHHLRLSTRCSC